ncbi:uncharacterized protein LOC119739594 [Patiria miniata]|uniref:Uncharacterized protein n=1 Tax=Patiria miniata TaxID=46514 RepID=A0A914B2E1_PATMI|nr:uncharacterized protein LOC119739594 [Patiria miniata]
MICILLVLLLSTVGNCQTGDYTTVDAASTTAGVDGYTGKDKLGCNASMSVSDKSVEEFRGLVDDGAIFVYLKLVFVDAEFDDPLSAYLEDIGNVINPLRWVWAKGGRGKLLLSSPFDFNQLSLTTLGTGVYSIGVKIHGCVDADNDDEQNMRMIALLLRDLIKDEGNKTEEDNDNEMLLCLEKQLGKGDFPLPGVLYFPGSSYSMMQASSAFDCWPYDSDTVERVAPTQYWLGWILAGGVILALYSPMALSFFVQKNKPECDSKGIERLSLVSDLPLGLKYVLCFWRNDNFCFASTRWTLFVTIFVLLQYIPVLVSFVTDMEDFMNRSSAFYRVGPINVIVSIVSHVLINLVFIIAAIVLMERFLRPSGQLFMKPLLQERERSSSVDSNNPSDGDGAAAANSGGSDGHDTTSGGRQGSTDSAQGANVEVEESNIAYRHIVMVEAPPHLWPPSTSLDSYQAFFYYMGWRAKMGLDTKAWRFVLVDWLWERVGAPDPGHTVRTFLCVVIFALLYLLYLPFALIFFAFNSLPLLYCMTRCLQTVLSNDVKPTELMFAFLISLASIAWFFKFVATFVYVAELLGYSFMGFVVNAEAVGSIVLVIVIFIGYVVTAITGFYDGYCVLFSNVMKIAEEAQREKKEAQPATAAATARQDGSTGAVRRAPSSQSPSSGSGGTEMPMTVIDDHGRDPAAPLGSADIVQASPGGGTSRPLDTPLIAVNARGIPSLELRLFWLIVDKHRPIRLQVGSTIFQLLVIGVGIGFGMSILAIANSLSQLSTTVSLFSSVIIAGVVPTVLLAVRSPASQDCYNQAKERQIKADIVHYAQKGELKDAAA